MESKASMSSSVKKSAPQRSPAACLIREIDPASDSEIALVAHRMRQTLIEVEGEETGSALYSMEWLAERVRWHLDAASCNGKVFLAEYPPGQIAGHTIVRAEADEAGQPYGLFSTTYVAPEARRHGLAQALLQHGEQWMQAQALTSSSTWTSETNMKLIRLFRQHGYRIVQQHVHEVTATVMVRLEKSFVA